MTREYKIQGERVIVEFTADIQTMGSRVELSSRCKHDYKANLA